MKDILLSRLHSHHLLEDIYFSTPEEVVRHYGCLQSQDIGQATWVIGSRIKNGTEEMVRDACRKWKIVRTWPMRGTLHYMSPKLVRPLLKLCAAKTLPSFIKRREFLWITKEIAEKSLQLMQKYLKWGGVLTRTQMWEMLEKNGIPMQTWWTYHLTCYAGTLGLICFWPPTEKEETFVLLDEWVKETEVYSQEKALAETTRAYFRGHGWATVDDFAWWTWLWKTASKNWISMIQDELESMVYEGKTYYYFKQKNKNTSPQWFHFIGWFDEYFLWYKDRSIVADIVHHEKLFTKNGIFFPIIIKDGKAIWVWKREFKKDTVIFRVELLPWSTPNKELLEKECRRYASFMWYTKVEMRIS